MAVSTKSAEKKPAAKAAPAKKTAPAAAKVAAAPGKKVAAVPAKAAAKKAPAKKKGEGVVVVAAGVSPDRRRHYVEVAAYYIAERNGFPTGNELEHWAAAEAEIDRLLAEGLLKV